MLILLLSSVDTQYTSIITAIDKRDPTQPSQRQLEKRKKKKTFSKARLIRATIIVLSPLLPIFVLIALSYIGVQGLVSRLRVSRLLASAALVVETNSHALHGQSEDSLMSTVGDHPEAQHILLDHKRDSEENALLMDALDATNEPPQDASPAELHQTKDVHWESLYNIKPSPEVEPADSLGLTDDQHTMRDRLLRLEWQRVVVFIKGFNAHGSIVCRQKRFENSGGRALVQHFVDSVQDMCF